MVQCYAVITKTVKSKQKLTASSNSMRVKEHQVSCTQNEDIFIHCVFDRNTRKCYRVNGPLPVFVCCQSQSAFDNISVSDSTAEKLKPFTFYYCNPIQLSCIMTQKQISPFKKCLHSFRNSQYEPNVKKIKDFHCFSCSVLFDSWYCSVL